MVYGAVLAVILDTAATCLSRAVGPLVVVAVSACSAAAMDTSDVAPDTRVFRDDALGIAIEVPASWRHEQDNGRHVFAGPAGDATFYTTVSLQIVRSDEPLADALTDAYGSVRGYPGFRWERREPASVAGRPAVRYGLGFELHEIQRRKSGVLLDTGRHLVDIAYGAPVELFFAGLPAFDAMIGSVSVY